MDRRAAERIPRKSRMSVLHPTMHWPWDLARVFGALALARWLTDRTDGTAGNAAPGALFAGQRVEHARASPTAGN